MPPSRSRTPAGGTFRCRAARCSAGRARSTAWCGCAASRRTTTTGRNSAIAAGAGTRCCRSSAASRATGAARTSCAAAAGRCSVTDIDESGPLYDSLFEAAASIGIPHNPDYNGERQEGIAMTQCSISGGFRMSTARVYLDPARARRNFRVETGAHAQCLLFEGTRCVGVRYTMQGQRVRGAGRARGDRVGRLDRLAATARALRHRGGGPPHGARHQDGARVCAGSARTCATTGRRA